MGELSSDLFRVIAVMVGAAIVGKSPGSIMRVETLCEGRWLASSTFCELPVGKRVAICMLLFTAVMLSDLVLAALRVATRAAVVATRAAVAAPRAIGAFASAAFHDAVAEWVARRALRERRARRAHYAAFAERERVKAKAEAERQRARGKPPKPKARKASAARPRAPKAKAEPAAKPAESEKLDVVPEVVPAEPAGVSYVSPDAVWKSNLQPDFNVSVCDGFDASSSSMLRELDESNRFVQKSAESASM